LNYGAVANETLVYMTGSPDDTSLPTIMALGTSASNIFRIFKGSFGLAVRPGEVSTYATLQIGYLNDRDNDAEVWIGAGVTAGDAAVSGGQNVFDLYAAAAGDILVSGGTTVINGNKAVDLLRAVEEATVYWNNTGTLGGAPLVADEAVLDFSQDMQVKTITNPIEVQSENARVNDPFQVVSNLRLDLNYVNAEMNGSKLGNNVRLTRGTPA
jgi:hypothetical protein